LLLADVFEEFRLTSLTRYGLDPAHFYTTPGLSFQACLKMTGVKLELLTDHDMLLMVENGIRGGTSTITCRESLADNKYVSGIGASEEASKYIMYLDANNLYGWAMSQPLPVGEFRWLSRQEINALRIRDIADEDETGYILEVDLGYPDHLHDLHNCYPLAVEKMVITEDLLSPTSKKLLEGRRFVKSEKLVPNLSPKVKYVVHYRNLKFYMEHGLILERIHRVIGFKQAPWLKPYIEANTLLRQQSKSKFEKDFFKLLNNSMYGKTMENLRRRTNVAIVSNVIAAERQVSKLGCQLWTQINERYTIVQSAVQKIFWNKPTTVGCAVLDLSKLLMYQFHYDVMQQRYGDKLKLLFTDTDSLCYEIETADVYADMMEMRDEYLDTSEYPPDHFLFSPKNAKVIGKFKDECGGKAPLHFVGLRPKMYSLLHVDDQEKLTAKGVKTSYVKTHMKHAHYAQCVNGGTSTSATYQVLRSRSHVIRTETITKRALSAYDDKRFLLPQTPDTLAYGHFRIRDSDVIAEMFDFIRDFEYGN
jgi:hypothetical protein